MYETAFLIGRIIVGGYYLYNGINQLINLPMMAKRAGSKGVPAPKLAILGTVTLLLIAGVTILLGWHPEIGVGALILFLIPVTVMMHNFWVEKDPMQRMSQKVNFLKNVALLGSALMYLAIPQPWPYSVSF